MLYLLVLLSLLSSFCSVVGFNFIVLANRFPVVSQVDKPTNLSGVAEHVFQELWNWVNKIPQRNIVYFVVGILFQLGGVGSGILALQYGPQTLRASLASVPIVMNMVVSLFYITRERRESLLVRRNVPNVLFLLVITTGLVLGSVSFFHTDSFESYDTLPTTIAAQVRSLDSVIFLAVMGGVALAGLGLAFFLFDRLRRLALLCILATLDGTFSALATTFFKVALHFIGQSGFEADVAWFVIAGLYASLFQIIAMFTGAAEHRDTLTQVYITVFTFVFIVVSLVSGGVVFDEFAYFEGSQVAMFSSGIAVSFLSLVGWGVWNLRSSRKDIRGE
jgi:hypothetical protein